MKTNDEMLSILMEYEDEYLIEATQDFKLSTIPENSPLRKLREECFGEEVGTNFLIQILNLGVLLSVDLARRCLYL